MLSLEQERNTPRMDRATTTLRTVLYAWAFLGTPALMLYGYGLFAAPAGANIRLHDVSADYLEGLVLALLLLPLTQILPIPTAHRRALGLLWLVRMGIALGAMLAYEATLIGDFVLYYNSGTALSHPFSYFEFGKGTRNVQALVGVLAMATEAYSAMKVVFAFIGLVAVYIFYRAAVVGLGYENIGLLYILGLFPSILFFGSLFGKEPIVFLGIAIYCYGVVGLIVQRRLRMVLYIALGLAIAAAIRPWLGTIFLAPVLFTYVMASRTPVLAKLGFLLIAVPAFLLAVQGFAERFQLESAQDLVARTDALSQAWAVGGSAQQISGGFGSLRDMILFIPLGAFTALFRPLPLEVMNPFGMLAGLENAVLLSLVVIGLIRQGVGWLGQPVLLWAAATLAAWSVAYGFISYQNLGGGFRYASMVTPILLMLGLYLAYAHRLRDDSQGQARRGPIPVGPTGGRAAEGPA